MKRKVVSGKFIEYSINKIIQLVADDAIKASELSPEEYDDVLVSRGFDGMRVAIVKYGEEIQEENEDASEGAE